MRELPSLADVSEVLDRYGLVVNTRESRKDLQRLYQENRELREEVMRYRRERVESVLGKGFTL